MRLSFDAGANRQIHTTTTTPFKNSTNKLMKRLEQLKREKQALANAVEQVRRVCVCVWRDPLRGFFADFVAIWLAARAAIRARLG